MPSYIETVEKLSKNDAILTVYERMALTEILKKALKWDTHIEKTTVTRQDLTEILEYYLDVKRILKEDRQDWYGHTIPYAKKLLLACDQNIERTKFVIDRADKMWTANFPKWTLKGCINNLGMLLSNE